MKTTARYTQTRSAASVPATAIVRRHPSSELVEIRVTGQLDCARQLRIICSVDEAEVLAQQLLEAAAQIRTAISAA
ncbi:hypothetical protein [Burkholderia sp. BCC0405]|uniref:hypothetical protein n=1 Tax=Burkholderia sp. BCC0405 TaxID=2676298 RepID=UPI00158C7FF1|nr:hypothetical protein [Burkholderia sp. BCC0405]